MWRNNGISVGMQDEFALESQQKYEEAYQAGKWRDEIIPVMITVGKTVLNFPKMNIPGQQRWKSWPS